MGCAVIVRTISIAERRQVLAGQTPVLAHHHQPTGKHDKLSLFSIEVNTQMYLQETIRPWPIRLGGSIPAATLQFKYSSQVRCTK